MMNGDERKFYVYVDFYGNRRGWYRIRGIDENGQWVGNFHYGSCNKPNIRYCQDYQNGKPVSEQTVRKYYEHQSIN